MSMYKDDNRARIMISQTLINKTMLNKPDDISLTEFIHTILDNHNQLALYSSGSADAIQNPHV